MSKAALDDVNLEINDGEFIGLIGHTGSGKSTLIQHLNALMKPTSGHIYLDGEDINADKSKLKSVRQRVGVVFQYPEHQLFEMTVFKDEKRHLIRLVWEKNFMKNLLLSFPAVRKGELL